MREQNPRKQFLKKESELFYMNEINFIPIWYPLLLEKV